MLVSFLGTGVSVYAVHPGIADTEIGRHMAMKRSYISAPFVNTLFWLLFKTPRQAAQTTLYCAVEPSIANDTGKYYQ